MAERYDSGMPVDFARGRTVVNVKALEFGAVGDGVADDREAIQNAIGHAESLYDESRRDSPHVPPYGRTRAYDHDAILLYFPPGRYRLGDNPNGPSLLRLSRPLRVTGAGYAETVFSTQAPKPILHYAPTMNADRGGTIHHVEMMRARIEQLGFEGSYAFGQPRGTLAGQDGVLATRDPAVPYNTYLDVRDCAFYGLGGAGIHGRFSTDPGDGDKFRIEGCFISRCGDYGIRLDGRHSTLWIVRNHITRNAGGVALAGLPGQVVSTTRILDNVIEANDGGPTGAPAGGLAGPKPFVGVLLTHANFCEIRGNYFEWHVNAVYVGDGCTNVSIVRNWFDGNDVNLPRMHAVATGALPARQVCPVAVRGSGISGVLLEENDCYVPARPRSPNAREEAAIRAAWNPPGSAWGEAYEVFPILDGTQHELIRNSARLGGGRRGDVTYAAAAADRVYFESVRPAVVNGRVGDVVEHVERTYRRVVEADGGIRLRSRVFRFEGSAAEGAVHEYVYPAGERDEDAVRARIILARREPATGGEAPEPRPVSEQLYLTDAGVAFPPHGFTVRSAGADAAARGVDFGDAPPREGRHARGAIRFNALPEVRGAPGSRYTLLGWRCVEPGTPGRWVEMRNPTGD